ncbi:hypothetical protein LTR08_003029 [Meristemomyces frigidus]|nr:hypothetical protein LTR08_003029 [Meristemomyces frigidus]
MPTPHLLTFLSTHPPKSNPKTSTHNSTPTLSPQLRPCQQIYLSPLPPRNRFFALSRPKSKARAKAKARVKAPHKDLIFAQHEANVLRGRGVTVLPLEGLGGGDVVGVGSVVVAVPRVGLEEGVGEGGCEREGEREGGCGCGGEGEGGCEAEFMQEQKALLTVLNRARREEGVVELELLEGEAAFASALPPSPPPPPPTTTTMTMKTTTTMKTELSHPSPTSLLLTSPPALTARACAELWVAGKGARHGAGFLPRHLRHLRHSRNSRHSRISGNSGLEGTEGQEGEEGEEEGDGHGEECACRARVLFDVVVYEGWRGVGIWRCRGGWGVEFFGEGGVESRGEGEG